jgi:import inner membrane translocase subunit TIM9
MKKKNSNSLFRFELTLYHMSWLFGGGGNNAAQQEQANVLKQLENLQKEDSMRTFNAVVERCFFNCVNSFTTSELEPREEQCVYRCTEKFFRHSQR